jgi:spectinomycin phosphotransferase
MLEKPSLPDRLIIARVRSSFGLQPARLDFLPLGADVNTAVYRLETADGAAFFLKLRKGPFDRATVAVPRFLHAHGVPAIIAPLQTSSRRLWARLGEYRLVLYPFIAGDNGYHLELADRQWIGFGAALGAIHAAPLPSLLRRLLQREDFSPRWRELVSEFQSQVERIAYTDSIAAQLALFMQDHRDEIAHLVRRAEDLASLLQSRSLDLVLCHSDIHAGNLHISPGGDFYIVDWDNPLLAPKERDLMFIGSGAVWNDPHQAELFYQGYGPAQVDAHILAYYRYERIVQDIAAFCQALLLTDAGGEDRLQSFGYFTGQFEPGQEVALAFASDPLP